MERGVDGVWLEREEWMELRCNALKLAFEALQWTTFLAMISQSLIW